MKKREEPKSYVFDFVHNKQDRTAALYLLSDDTSDFPTIIGIVYVNEIDIDLFTFQLQTHNVAEDAKWFNANRFWYVQEVAIIPEHLRDLGLGKQLMSEFYLYVLNSPLFYNSVLTLFASPEDKYFPITKLVNFYSRYGFEEKDTSNETNKNAVVIEYGTFLINDENL